MPGSDPPALYCLHGEIIFLDAKNRKPKARLDFFARPSIAVPYSGDDRPRTRAWWRQGATRPDSPFRFGRRARSRRLEVQPLASCSSGNTVMLLATYLWELPAGRIDPGEEELGLLSAS